jgi:hypothetical protein
MNAKRTSRRMPQFEPGGGKNKKPATLEDYELVREGKGTREQIAKVRNALANKFSPLSLELGESAPWARMMIERKFGTPPSAWQLMSPAEKNLHTFIDFLRDKREAGTLSDKEVNAVLESTRVSHLMVDNSSPSGYAMSVARMKRALNKIRPDLASEVKSLPISRNRQ